MQFDFIIISVGRKYERKSAKIELENLEDAIEAVKNESFQIKTAAAYTKMIGNTFKKYLKGGIPSSSSAPCQGRFHTTFNEDQEKAVSDFCVTISERYEI